MDKPYPIVEVEWTDSAGHDGWHSKHDIATAEDMENLSVGYLVREDEQTITICLGIGAQGETFLSSMTIPRFAIKSIHELSLAGEPL